jgi:protein-tyrosine phosphatase
MTTRERMTRDFADLNWVTDRIAVGGGIFGPVAMADVAAEGITHIVSLSEFDESPLAAEHGVAVLHDYVEDDFEPKDAAWFGRCVKFAKAALAQKGAKLLVHCAGGINRAPMMTLAVLCSMGWNVEKAMRHMRACRPCVSFPDVYVTSVERYLGLDQTAEDL